MVSSVTMIVWNVNNFTHVQKPCCVFVMSLSYLCQGFVLKVTRVGDNDTYWAVHHRLSSSPQKRCGTGLSSVAVRDVRSKLRRDCVNTPDVWFLAPTNVPDQILTPSCRSLPPAPASNSTNLHSTAFWIQFICDHKHSMTQYYNGLAKCTFLDADTLPLPFLKLLAKHSLSRFNFHPRPLVRGHVQFVTVTDCCTNCWVTDCCTNGRNTTHICNSILHHIPKNCISAFVYKSTISILTIHIILNKRHQSRLQW